MDVRKAFEVLDLAPGTCADGLRRAYKDAVTIWHPDRFPENPRLRKKAEEKLKEINEAYELLSNHFSKVGRMNLGSQGANRPFVSNPEVSKTEAVAELGTRLVLQAFHYVYMRLKEKS